MRVIKKGFLCLALTCVFCLANMATALASFEYGDNGPEVLAIQKRLVELKYEIKLLDGDFGSETEAAVKRFQADQQLEVDGIIGEATYTALMQKPMPPNRSGRSATVRNVIRAAYGVIGTPYVFGGTSVYGFDCSGFTQYAFARAGISLPRTADVQMYSGIGAHVITAHAALFKNINKLSIKQCFVGSLFFYQRDYISVL